MRVLIVDDEPAARDRLARLLARSDDVQVVGQYDTGRAAVEALRSKPVDLVFLDAQLPDVDAFRVVVDASPTSMPPVVFMTPADATTIRALQMSAADYLVKPFTADRFAEALNRVRHSRSNGGRPLPHSVADRPLVPAQPAAVNGAAYVERLPVRADTQTHFVAINEIDWIETDANYVRVHAGQSVHRLRGTMASLEAQLDPSRFVRIHRQFIVNMDRVKKVQPWFAGDMVAILSDGTKLRVSRHYRAHFFAGIERAPQSQAAPTAGVARV
jgi:two-component system LytT family response regulator